MVTSPVDCLYDAPLSLLVEYVYNARFCGGPVAMRWIRGARIQRWPL